MTAPWLSNKWLTRVNGTTIRVCPHPDCQKEFVSAPFEGVSGRLYCSKQCRADMSDEEVLQ